MSLRSDDLDSIVELYTEDDFRQLVVTSETMPTFLGGLCELEVMASAVLFERQALDRTVRCRTVANVLSIGFVTGMRITVPARTPWIALVLAYGVTIRDEGHREHVSGQADAYVEP